MPAANREVPLPSETENGPLSAYFNESRIASLYLGQQNKDVDRE
jgi:hypothetical protein